MVAAANSRQQQELLTGAPKTADSSRSQELERPRRSDEGGRKIRCHNDGVRDTVGTVTAGITRVWWFIQKWGLTTPTQTGP